MLDHVNLSKAVDQLPHGYRQMFILHDVEGYGHSEIAQIPGMLRLGTPSPSCLRLVFGFGACCKKRFAAERERNANA